MHLLAMMKASGRFCMLMFAGTKPMAAQAQAASSPERTGVRMRARSERMNGQVCRLRLICSHRLEGRAVGEELVTVLVVRQLLMRVDCTVRVRVEGQAMVEIRVTGRVVVERTVIVEIFVSGQEEEVVIEGTKRVLVRN